MSQQRKNLNLYLIFLTLILGALAVRLSGLPELTLSSQDDETAAAAVPYDTLPLPVETAEVAAVPRVDADTMPQQSIAPQHNDLSHITAIKATTFNDIETRTMTADHPFKAEAIKVLSGRLEENDSLSRRKILSYCEHLRSAYTTRDIDFIRQVFSDNALIIVGHVVKTGESATGMNYSDRVKYSIRSKKEYLERLTRIFDSKKEIDVKFSDFKIMRHPTMEGIYGVTLRQKYVSGSYSDDGYLFLLWDFRNPSMPLIHVRTWQPTPALGDDDEMIDISDFNLD